jgi:uncharacterized protein (TIGR03083 family)
VSTFDVRQAIVSESDGFAAAIDPELLAQRVPGCPEWTQRDLVWHLGRVQRFWASVIRARADVEPTRTAVQGPNDAPELQEWMRASTNELLDALDDVPPETPAWTWWRDNRTVGAIARHQVQEAAVHRWDAESVGGAPAPLSEPVATDGVVEFLGIARQLRAPAPILFTTTDSGVRVAAADGPPAVTVAGTASNLVLLLHGRIDPGRVSVEGDRAALEQFLVPIG